MSHSFAPVPTNYKFHRPGLWACRHCGVFSDKQGADVIQTYPDCSDFDRDMRRASGTNHYAPGQPDYPFANSSWGKPSAGGTWVVGGGGGAGAGVSSQGLSSHAHSVGAISGGVCGHGTLDPALTASGLPIRVEINEHKAPPTKHIAGIDAEEIDWSAHKEFMKGM